MKKNIILITGGAGFIGSSLINYFIKNNYKYKIISLDNYSSGSVKTGIAKLSAQRLLTALSKTIL